MTGNKGIQAEQVSHLSWIISRGSAVPLRSFYTSGTLRIREFELSTISAIGSKKQDSGVSIGVSIEKRRRFVIASPDLSGRGDPSFTAFADATSLCFFHEQKLFYWYFTLSKSKLHFLSARNLGVDFTLNPYGSPRRFAARNDEKKHGYEIKTHRHSFVIASPDLSGRGDPSFLLSLNPYGLQRRFAARNDEKNMI